jgi:hypothetical protein
VPLPTPVPATKACIIVTVPAGLMSLMLCAVGIPDAEVAQPASDSRLKERERARDRR